VYPLSWSDASGNLWLFGGLGYDSTSAFGVLNDLWKFDPALGANGEWAWMGGSNAVGSNGGQSGVYGTLGTEASTNAPGGRDNAVSWSDASGNLWLFGGLGYDSTGIEGDLNDLWKYQP
jgi:N-acetylneuraminic acid mutarotase